ncbi:MAG: epimerase [Marinilabiliales bacterium]|nr:MAG: epimerase [Marinilabiliales bacterium]
MKIGVTGASGHIGANLTRLLLEKNYSVRVLEYIDNRAIEGLDVERVKGSLDDQKSLETFCQDLDVVFHLAARISIGANSFETLHKVNVEGTMNLVRACKNAGVKKIIYFSSIHALNHHPLDQPLDESRPLVSSSQQAYERTKSMSESWILEQKTDHFEVVVLNPTAVVGPIDHKPSLMGELLLRMYRGKIPGLIPGGYNWVDVRDVAEAAANAIDRGKSGEHYILSGKWYSLKEYAETLQKVCGKKIKKVVLPFWMARIGVPFIQIWSKLTNQQPLYTKESLDIVREGNKNILNEKARKELGFNPRPLSESLKDSFTWFKENNYF